MLILLAIGFLAGVVTAVSPCVLPVLPILLAAGASGRKPLRIVAGPRRQLHRVHPVRRVAARPARAPGGFPAQRGDRPPVRDGGDTPHSACGAADRAAARVLLALPPGRRRRGVLPRRDARARIRAVRRAGARDGHRRRGQRLRRTARDLADARVRRRSSIADAPDRPRWTGSGRPAAPARRRPCG